MKYNFILGKYFPYLSFIILLIFFVGCKENTVEPTVSSFTDKAAITDILLSDSLLTTFEPNYNEDGTLNFLSKTTAEINPLKVWHKMKLVNKNVDVTFSADTAYAKITNTFDGTLFILASYNQSATIPDTLIKKSFTSVITRNAILTKIAKTDNPEKNWIISAISLPMGGTQSSDISITKVTVFLPNEDTLVISSPNDYYLIRKWGHWWRWHNVPVIPKNREVKVRVELTSAYQNDDYVSLTFGADRFGFDRTKKLFDLVSSEQDGGIYNKVYEQTFRSNLFPGFFHAIINAMPKQVVNDDSTPVELDSWGMPYFVKF